MPEPRITLDQWRALVAVVDKGGYARAAAALHKSQSSVTYGVQQLESQLGVKAFKIAGRTAELTPTGELLYRRARYLLAEAAALRPRRASRTSSAQARPQALAARPAALSAPRGARVEPRARQPSFDRGDAALDVQSSRHLDRGGRLGLWICVAAGRKDPPGTGGRQAEAASHAGRW